MNDLIGRPASVVAPCMAGRFESRRLQNRRYLAACQIRPASMHGGPIRSSREFRSSLILRIPRWDPSTWESLHEMLRRHKPCAGESWAIIYKAVTRSSSTAAIA